MYEEDFALRLAKLRTQKGVSAREMSLSIGANSGYINNIETGKALPSMSNFFFICDYLGISPMEFFEEENTCPDRLRNLVEELKGLSPDQLNVIRLLAREFKK